MPRFSLVRSMIWGAALAVPAPLLAVGPEEQPPIAIAATYTADVLAVVDGGKRRGVRYLDNLDVTLDADLARLVSLPRTRAFVYALYNNGTNFSGTLAGDAQAVSNIETGTRALRLYEAWVEHGGDAFSVRAGLYDLNSEFDALESSALFIGSAHGVGTDISQTGENGPSIFPVTAPAVRVQAKVASNLVVRAAIFDGMAGDPAHPARTVLRVDPSDGALMIGELDWRLGDARVLAGAWNYTARFAVLTPTGVSPVRRRGNDGYYLRGEARLAGRDDGAHLDAFARLGVASGRFNLFDRFASAGLNLSGVIDPAHEDSLGLAVAYARTSAPARAADPNLGRSETAFELTYRFRLTDRIAVQPDLQYVVNPSADRGTRDALIAGVRFELALTQP